jgi:hypothetical protein
LDNLQNVADGVPLVPVSANIAPLPFGAHEDGDEGGETAADGGDDGDEDGRYNKCQK